MYTQHADFRFQFQLETGCLMRTPQQLSVLVSILKLLFGRDPDGLNCSQFASVFRSELRIRRFRAVRWRRLNSRKTPNYHCVRIITFMAC